GGERGRRGARRGESDVAQRRARGHGSRRRQDPVAALGAGVREERGRRRAQDRGGVGGGLVIRFHAVTIFPEMFAAVTASGITSRALQQGLWALELWNPRDSHTGTAT